MAISLHGLGRRLAGASAALIAIQLLDGLANAIFGVVSVLVVADRTRGSGRFNLVQGALATAVGIGAALSTSFGGKLKFIVLNRGANKGGALASQRSVAKSFKEKIHAVWRRLRKKRAEAPTRPVPRRRRLLSSGMGEARTSAVKVLPSAVATMSRTS